MSSTSSKYDLRKLSEIYFSLAKRWWGASLLCKAGAIIIGILFVMLSILPKEGPLIILVVGIASEVLVWQSDKMKSTAESLLRKLDFRDSFGWKISNDEMSDTLARTSDSILIKAMVRDKAAEYFESKDEMGIIRALKNVQESAWWSKHLAQCMKDYVLTATILAIVFSVSLFLFSLYTVNRLDTLQAIGRVVTAIFTFILSLGLIRMLLGYQNFSQKAQSAEKLASILLKDGCTETEAVKLYCQYHLDRAMSPLIPDFVYHWRREKLNELWKGYRTD